jgi:hypothetical protein
MKYKFGIMSSKYELDADSEKDAKVGMVLFLKSSCPIAIYSPETSAFNPTEFMELLVKEEYKPEKLGEIMESIKESSLSD